ncbi:acetyltransferase [Paenibacillus sp. DMB20]|uniref:acetyltransferase n=1 Tax=Paenibacillus sp. DMB20 TaxID=1642570 RepID=UPI000628015B|nr:acetyltransferase [Paenibacillus sp. DMB20]KKO54973.1 acetyltransferase [Paenibacillus sp. DMB20]
MSYIVFGAGGHAKVVVEILRSRSETILGVMDDHSEEKVWNGLPVLGGANRIYELKVRYPDALFLVAIGDNSTRMSIVAQLDKAGIRYGTAVHPSAVVASDAALGEGTVVMPMAVINSAAEIGNHVIINTAATVDHDCRIANFTHISPGVNLAGGVKVGEAAHIGIGAALIPGVTVGADTIVGAASCVIRDLPDRVVAVGCPAKIIKNRKG